MHFLRGGAEYSWVRSALVDGAWDRWLGNVIEVLRAAIAYVENRLLRLLVEVGIVGVEFARDLGIPGFLSELRRTLGLLEPKVRLIPLRREWFFFAFARNFCVAGLGDAGCVPIVDRTWDSKVPEDFPRVAQSDLRGVPSPLEQDTIMVSALRGHRLLHPVADKGLKPNGGVFAIPKNAEKASLIVNMVPFNRAMAAKQPSLHLPCLQ